LANICRIEFQIGGLSLQAAASWLCFKGGSIGSGGTYISKPKQGCFVRNGTREKQASTVNGGIFVRRLVAGQRSPLECKQYIFHLPSHIASNTAGMGMGTDTAVMQVSRGLPGVGPKWESAAVDNL
jgi:hypothetical protein